MRVGEVLADKYEVTKILGQGGMGVVVAARHRELDKLVALKFMHEEVAVNVTAIDRFLREARAAARLRSEHVGHVMDVGRLPNGVPYIVMEFLEGHDLSQVLELRGPLSVSDAVEYVLQTCEAIAEAHTHGIIHRDLKPQNLFLTMRPDGRPLVKVLDFGISKVQAAGGPTATQQTMGTPAYMAPEQMRSARSADARADIWSIGVILYQLLSGSLPFNGETIAEIMLRVMSDPMVPIGTVRAGLPAPLVRAIEKCLEKDRNKRFDNVAQLAHELVPFAPERARAAMSLIERVMSAGIQQPARSAVEEQLLSVVPLAATVPPTVPPTVSTEAPAPSGFGKAMALQTTLGGAASAMSFDKPARQSSARLIAVSIVAVVAAIVITVFATRGGHDAGRGGNDAGSTAYTSSPDLVVTSPDATLVAADAATSDSEQVAPVALSSVAGSGSSDVALGSGRTLPSARGSGVKGGSSGKRNNGSAAPPGSAVQNTGSAVPSGGSATSTTGSGSSPQPKERKPVGDGQDPRGPVGD
ncbi:MAG: serine/threonine protein kinase [Deltaproteobacteria bacterium]|nr:serine/threonine protein kinase [Deltaproteobacteria bacterium]